MPLAKETKDIEGVKVFQNPAITVVSIDEFTVELQDLLKERLAEICWGPTANGSKLVAESYEYTMQSLWGRVSNKHFKTQIGMAGELITHLFLARPSAGYVSVNRMFNLEESSIKKGFDLVLTKQESGELFLVEVKASGILTSDSKKKVLNLLKVSNNDMNGKLNKPADNLWNNALSHCSSALKKTDLRDKIEAILEVCRDEALTFPSAKDQNVILAGINFNGDKGFCDLEEIAKSIAAYKKWGQYKSLTYFVAQKKTYTAVLTFIESEAALCP
ncbi:hypothetical protein MWU61_06870 [Loktanella sp. F6476L]|uniref:hypothetical protein n=1 Tax=Loktanella sp. F6476L TaxID=2926405 RepID=UPI001FF2562B|nr:hypothetical protein [Loktanella sp. F6476L]MCK0120255.1 hypothetical protein [Loktanella sp. F6476L]